MLVQNLLIVFLVLLIALSMIDPALAAGKKKKSKTDLEVEKVLTPIVEQLTPLSNKAASQGLFSPEDAAKAQEMKLQLLDLIHEYPTNQQLVKPAYEAARLFRFREMYDDAFDFYQYVTTNFANTPYASLSRVEIQRMKQVLGESYFAEPAPPEAAPATAKP